MKTDGFLSGLVGIFDSDASLATAGPGGVRVRSALALGSDRRGERWGSAPSWFPPPQAPAIIQGC